MFSCRATSQLEIKHDAKSQQAGQSKFSFWCLQRQQVSRYKGERQGTRGPEQMREGFPASYVEQDYWGILSSGCYMPYLKADGA